MIRRCLMAVLAMWLAAQVSSLLADSPRDDSTPTPAAPEQAAPVTDPTQVTDYYRKILSRPEYQESSGPDTNARLRDLLSRWFSRIGEDFDQFSYSQQMPRFASMLMAVFVVISIVGLVYTGIRLARRRGEWLPAGPAEAAGEKTFRPPEFYEEQLRRAVAAGDWHEAWLASWRQFLSRLEHGRIVEADRSRTNREYLSQLRAQPLPAAAEALLPSLVDAYDQFIYGRKPIGERDWNAFQQQVNEAALMLHLGEAASPEPVEKRP